MLIRLILKFIGIIYVASDTVPTPQFLADSYWKFQTEIGDYAFQEIGDFI